MMASGNSKVVTKETKRYGLNEGVREKELTRDECSGVFKSSESPVK